MRWVRSSAWAVIGGLIFLLVGTLLAPEPLHLQALAEAGNSSTLPQGSVMMKGFVTAKTERSMTLLDGRQMSVEVVIDTTTEIMGQRDSFIQIMTHDIVQVDGVLIGDRQMLARSITVVFAADSLALVQKPQLEVRNTFSLILDGGITVPLR